MQQTTNKISDVELAQSKVNLIREEILNGNSKITPQQLSNAQSEVEFALLRQEAVEAAKAKAAEAERKEHLLDLQKRLSEVGDSRKSVDAKFASFEKALADYLTTAANYQNSLDGIRTSLQSAALYPEPTPLIAGVPPGLNIGGIRITDIRRQLTIGDAVAENVLPDQEIKPVIERALGEYNRNF